MDSCGCKMNDQPPTDESHNTSTDNEAEHLLQNGAPKASCNAETIRSRVESRNLSSDTDISLDAVLDSKSFTRKCFSSFIESNATSFPNSDSRTGLSSFQGYSTRAVLDSNSIQPSLSSQSPSPQTEGSQQDRSVCRGFSAHFKLQDRRRKIYNEEEERDKLIKAKIIEHSDTARTVESDDKKTCDMYSLRKPGYEDNSDDSLNPEGSSFWADLVQKMDGYRSASQRDPNPEFWENITERLKECLDILQRKYPQIKLDELDNLQNDCPDTTSDSCDSTSGCTTSTCKVNSIIDYDDIKHLGLEESSCKELESSCSGDTVSCRAESLSCREDSSSCREDNIGCRENTISCSFGDGQTWEDFLQERVSAIEAVRRNYNEIIEDFKKKRLGHLRMLHALERFSKMDIDDDTLADTCNRDDNSGDAGESSETGNFDGKDLTDVDICGTNMCKSDTINQQGSGSWYYCKTNTKGQDSFYDAQASRERRMKDIGEQLKVTDESSSSTICFDAGTEGFGQTDDCGRQEIVDGKSNGVNTSPIRCDTYEDFYEVLAKCGGNFEEERNLEMREKEKRQESEEEEKSRAEFIDIMNQRIKDLLEQRNQIMKQLQETRKDEELAKLLQDIEDKGTDSRTSSPGRHAIMDEPWSSPEAYSSQWGALTDCDTDWETMEPTDTTEHGEGENANTPR